MNSRILLCLGAVVLAQAIPASATTITTGAPDAFGVGLSPVFGVKVNFDDLTPLSTLNPAVYSSVGISSILDNPASTALLVLPYSNQTPPNYLSTGASDNYAGNVTFTFTNLSNQVGIGVSEDGTTPVTLTALGAAGNVLGAFTETPSSTFNAYYVLADSAFDIKSVTVSAAQNLAIDDVQFTVAPEPATLALAGAGILLMLMGKRSGKRVG